MRARSIGALVALGVLALAAGWAKAVKLRGADPAQWRWGDIHPVTISHPLSAVPAIAARLFTPIFHQATIGSE